MASTITADTGAVSGSAGLKSAADSSGILALATGTGTTAVTIDASQRVGVGTTSPATQFQVTNSANTGATFRLSSSATEMASGTLGTLDWYSNDASTGGTGVKAYIKAVDDSTFGTQYSLTFGTSYVSGGVNTEAERMRLNSAGNLGLGVTPSAWGSSFKAFDVNSGAFAAAGADSYQLSNAFYNGTNWIYKTGAAASWYRQQSGAHQWFNAASGTAGNAISFTQAMTLDASGKLNIGGTTTPSAGASQLSLSGYSGNDGGLQLNASGGAGGLIATPSGAGLRFLTYTGSVGSESYTERARIDSSGNLLVGTTNADPSGSGVTGIACRGDGLFEASNSSYCGDFGRNGSDGQLIRFRRSSTVVGSISVTTTSTSYATSSDYRLKENIASMTGALSVVQQLNPCTYTWKADGSDGQGFIAHELQAVVPDAVTGEKDAVDAEGNPLYQGIDTSFLVATLTAAIQEQQAIITTLTERISALEGAK